MPSPTPIGGKICTAPAYPRPYVLRETIVNIRVNVVLTPLLYPIMYETGHDFAVWGNDGLLVELMTQAISVAVFGSAMPSYTAWSKVRTGKLVSFGWVPRPSGIVRYALLLGCVAAAVIGTMSVGVIAATDITHASFTAVMIVKATLGAVIAAAVTPPALRRTLVD